jgi:hypothetical protein
MSMREIFDLLGLPIEDWRGLWPDDPLSRLNAKAARLSNKLQRIYQALIRRRCRIEYWRQEIERYERYLRRLAVCTAILGNDSEGINLVTEVHRRLERSRRIVEKHEARYQFLLTQHSRTRKEFANLRVKLRTSKIAP